MDVTILNLFLRPIVTVTYVWNTEETGDIYILKRDLSLGPFEPTLFEHC